MEVQIADRIRTLQTLERRNLHRQTTGSHVVYFVQRQDARVKIGFTGNLSSRLISLQAEHGPLVLLGVRAGGRMVETELHLKFQRWRLGRSEWFEPVEPLLREASRCRYRPSFERHGTVWQRYREGAA